LPLSGLYLVPLDKPRRPGLPTETRLYDLRHTFSTLWRKSGEPLEILQNILAHTRFSVTADHYVHFTPVAQREPMKRFGERFS
jgi:integrase